MPAVAEKHAKTEPAKAQANAPAQTPLAEPGQTAQTAIHKTDAAETTLKTTTAKATP